MSSFENATGHHYSEKYFKKCISTPEDLYYVYCSRSCACNMQVSGIQLFSRIVRSPYTGKIENYHSSECPITVE